jgi:hypothetical protein
MAATLFNDAVVAPDQEDPQHRIATTAVADLEAAWNSASTAPAPKR